MYMTYLVVGCLHFKFNVMNFDPHSCSVLSAYGTSTSTVQTLVEAIQLDHMNINIECTMRTDFRQFSLDDPCLMAFILSLEEPRVIVLALPLDSLIIRGATPRGTLPPNIFFTIILFFFTMDLWIEN